MRCSGQSHPCPLLRVTTCSSFRNLTMLAIRPAVNTPHYKSPPFITPNHGRQGLFSCIWSISVPVCHSCNSCLASSRQPEQPSGWACLLTRPDQNSTAIGLNISLLLGSQLSNNGQYGLNGCINFILSSFQSFKPDYTTPFACTGLYPAQIVWLIK